MIERLSKAFNRLIARPGSHAGQPDETPESIVSAPLQCGKTRAVPLATAVIRNLDEYRDLRYSLKDEYAKRFQLEQSLMAGRNELTSGGWCYVCDKPSQFLTDFLSSAEKNAAGEAIPNWRERMVCENCGLNNRLRACLHFLEQNLTCRRDAAIYISEQSTPLFAYLSQHYPNVTGSEYFGKRIPPGAVDEATGFRNESVTKLTFGDARLDFILSFDVFEHVPDYLLALAEAWRCLKPGGKLLFSVPFAQGSATTQVHAKTDVDGNIVHLTAPVYHGDPINPEGCLCFHTFGWDILEQLRNAGFSSAEAHIYWSEEFAYLGVEQMLLTATK